MGYSRHLREDIFLEPTHTLYVTATLSQAEDSESSSSKLNYLDILNVIHQTILDENSIHNLPSAHNVWALIENQDLSATTNRIDVGGLWGGIPGLFSSRGGCSWTQNSYLLNGMDVTDPYWTGIPLFYPDYFSLRYTQLIDAGHPIQTLFPGCYYNLITREGSDQFHGSISTFYIQHSLQSSNISSRLQEEGLNESHGFDYLTEGNVQISGPLSREKATFFASISAFDLSRNMADFSEADKSSLVSGLFNLKYKLSDGGLRLLWTGQKVTHPTYGAKRHIPLSSTLDRKELYNVFQILLDKRIRDNHYFKSGICFTQGNIDSFFQSDNSSPYGLEIFTKIPRGSAPLASQEERSTLTFQIMGESFIKVLNVRHKLQYGLQARYCRASSIEDIRDNIHLHFYGDQPLEVVQFNTPVEHGESAAHLNFFLQDTLTLPNFVSFYLGINFATSQAKVHDDDHPDTQGANEIHWVDLSPRFGLIIPLSREKTSALKLSYARYFYTLPLNIMSYGNPDAWGSLVFSWKDVNQDSLYQTGELGKLLRREGPQYSVVDPDLKRPFTDEIALSYSAVFGSSWTFYLGGFHRVTRNLIRSLNVGVPFEAYDPFYYTDTGDDRIPFTHDDLLFTVYNQKEETLGQDYFLISNVEPDTRTTTYFGFDLNLIKKFSERFTFFLSLTATQADGETNPGNTEWENDDGLIGSLFDNPNTLINGKGRVRFDRAYTGRLGFNYLAPYGIRIGCIIKYYDGQPFARKIIIEGLNQGPFYIQAHPRGVARYEYNRTIDIRIEKIIRINKSRLRLILDGFNILNRGFATEENEWTGPEFPLRYATEIQSPRVFRLGLSYEF